MKKRSLMTENKAKEEITFTRVIEEISRWAKIIVKTTEHILESDKK